MRITTSSFNHHPNNTKYCDLEVCSRSPKLVWMSKAKLRLSLWKMTKNSFKYTVSKKEKKKTTQQTPIITQSQTFHAVDFFFFKGTVCYCEISLELCWRMWGSGGQRSLDDAREVWTMVKQLTFGIHRAGRGHACHLTQLVTMATELLHQGWLSNIRAQVILQVKVPFSSLPLMLRKTVHSEWLNHPIFRPNKFFNCLSLKQPLATCLVFNLM